MRPGPLPSCREPLPPSPVWGADRMLPAEMPALPPEGHWQLFDSHVAAGQLSQT